MVSKGTVTTTVRWEEGVRDGLLQDAQKKGYTLSAFIREMGMQYLKKVKGYTLEKKEEQAQVVGVHPTEEKTIPVDIGNGEVVDVPEHLRIVRPSNASVPYYNPDIHHAGDKVMIKVGHNLVEATVPDLDAEGREIPKDG